MSVLHHAQSMTAYQQSQTEKRSQSIFQTAKDFVFCLHAGNRMANTCPKMHSCGTINPIWSDEEPPPDALIISNMLAYLVDWNNCRSQTLALEVMRCSLESEYDLIYKYLGPYQPQNCASAFCSTGYSWG